MNKSASKIKMNSRFDEMFASAATVKGDKRQIDLTQLHPFKNHPFHVVDDDRMAQLVESIKERGILVPGLARPREEGGYELISGHRRKRAAELAGLVEMPVEIREMTDDEAVIAMVDANLQREETLPSEKAFAYKMKLEALSHQGKKMNPTSYQADTKSELVARGVEMEAYSVDDGGKEICFHVFVYNVQPGVEINYLTGDSREEKP